ncbi:MAG: AAA family ATPase [Planctomycetia bacterium]
MTDAVNDSDGAAALTAAADVARRVRAALAEVLVGQRALVDRLLAALLVGGHVLLEGVPGVAKTLAARSLAAAVGADFRRIPFTPDLLPADVVGGEVYNPKTGEFTLRRGPIFANIVLADEINRAPAKVQSALLEAMQEGRVTLAGSPCDLPRPFFVLATQNSLDHEGTYPLPEAQVDRFLFKVEVGCPSREEEAAIIERQAKARPESSVPATTTPDEVLHVRRCLDFVYMAPAVREYVLNVVRSTRDPAGHGAPNLREAFERGAGPRASIGLMLAAKAAAVLDGRGYVTPYDVKSNAPDVLRHRVVLSLDAEAAGRTPADVLSELLDALPTP